MTKVEQVAKSTLLMIWARFSMALVLPVLGIIWWGAQSYLDYRFARENTQFQMEVTQNEQARQRIAELTAIVEELQNEIQVTRGNAVVAANQAMNLENMIEELASDQEIGFRSLERILASINNNLSLLRRTGFPIVGDNN